MGIEAGLTDHSVTDDLQITFGKLTRLVFFLTWAAVWSYGAFDAARDTSLASFTLATAGGYLIRIALGVWWWTWAFAEGAHNDRAWATFGGLAVGAGALYVLAQSWR